MKLSFILILFFFLSWVDGQKCNCLKKTELKNLISCQPTQFQNGARIYWEYDCNTSWITFQKGNIKKKIFELEKEFIELTGRLGYRSWTEYKTSFLIENSLVSGCCQPAEYILYNKNTGKKITSLGTIISINDKKDHPYIITLIQNNKLLYTNLNNNKSCTIKVPQDKIKSTLKNTNELYPENLFENAGIKNEVLTIRLRYKESNNTAWKIKTITLNTKIGSK
ncbi:hypothetical protein [Chryseobacterium sp. YR459]|uniref:hypothetical protein n=1 Tax=Chryseobacterium sp. HR92 TaxID=3094839 RepID=UPI000647D6D1|nr:hypothetical protein SFA27_03025 [Chryseobacterium sp. HR92]